MSRYAKSVIRDYARHFTPFSERFLGAPLNADDMIRVLVPRLPNPFAIKDLVDACRGYMYDGRLDPERLWECAA